MFVLARGTAGELRVGYQRAARVVRWSVSHDPEQPTASKTYTVDLQLDEPDPYWLYHADKFLLRLVVGKQEWRWNDVVVALGSDMQASVRLERKPEVRACPVG